MSNKLRSQFQNMKPSAMLKMFNATSQYDNLINLGVGEPDLESPKEVIDVAVQALENGYTHYPPMTGYADLRQEICNYWEKHHGLKRTANEVIVTSGAIQALYLVLTAFIDPGDEVIVSDPCFPSYINQIKFVNGVVVPVPVSEKDGFNMTAEALEKAITPKSKLLILNSPGNPTGAVLSRREMEEIAKVVKKHDLIVISDEIYEALIYNAEHVSFATIDGMMDRTFTIAGFSKTYAMTGWRLGYIMCDSQYIPALGALTTDIAMGVNAPTQRAGYVALKDCQYFVDKMNKIYSERISYTAKLINETEGLSCVKPKGSFYIMANITETGMTSEEFSMKMLEDARVVVMPGISFGENGDNFVRISCNGDKELLDEAFLRIRNAMAGIKYIG
ncbi:pyridoxal phosphate-dependent aminotransferase [Vagococcus fluvialis]|uniref:Aminotransferase n=1 Tax=Vagococcus fluvialis TaxID=2738 RepID=A0A7X6I473_9ENTE|nr:pyridoxal phosphate-dependent aminotransferase [Vagococcus fluvialis]NKC68559.1 pyridoxal phosphate-dependent aminotransferase [Vagococcus fluvialis]